MTPVNPKLTSCEALTLCRRLSKKFNELDFNRALDQEDHVVLDRIEAMEVIEGLKKLEERLQWSV